MRGSRHAFPDRILSSHPSTWPACRSPYPCSMARQRNCGMRRCTRLRCAGAHDHISRLGFSLQPKSCRPFCLGQSRQGGRSSLPLFERDRSNKSQSKPPRPTAASGAKRPFRPKRMSVGSRKLPELRGTNTAVKCQIPEEESSTTCDAPLCRDVGCSRRKRGRFRRFRWRTLYAST